MIRLASERVLITGESEDVRAVKGAFGELSFEGVNWFGSGPPVILQVKRFSNWYKDSSGKSPLYCLIPDQPIYGVWPQRDGSVEEVKFGTASNASGRVCGGIAVHLANGVGLYFCLSPSGSVIKDEDSFGI